MIHEGQLIDMFSMWKEDLFLNQQRNKRQSQYLQLRQSI